MDANRNTRLKSLLNSNSVKAYDQDGSYELLMSKDDREISLWFDDAAEWIANDPKRQNEFLAIPVALKEEVLRVVASRLCFRREKKFLSN